MRWSSSAPEDFLNAAPAATWNEETDLIAAGYSESQISTYLKGRYSGSTEYPTFVVLPDPDYVNDELTLLAYNAVTRNELGYEVQRLSYFDLAQPTASGTVDSLESEQVIHCQPDGSGNFLFFQKHRANRLIVWELNTTTRRAAYLKEVDISAISTNERFFIHPHPTLADTVFYIVGQDVVRTNIRTADSFASGNRTLIVSLGYTPALPASDWDGNGVRSGRILIPESSGHNVVWMLDVATGQAVTHVSGVETLVAVASRVSLTLPAYGSSGLDYPFVSADGKYILAVCKGTSGPDGSSGCYIWAPGTAFLSYIARIVSGTGHYSTQLSTYRGSSENSVITKVNTAIATALGGGLEAGDHVCIPFSITYSAGTYTYSAGFFRVMPWPSPNNNNSSGGQHFSDPAQLNVAGLTMKAKWTASSPQNDANYDTADRWGAEEIFLFDLSRADGLKRFGKNITRDADGTGDQTEANLLGVGPDGTRYVVFKTKIGPPEGSTTNLLTNKDAYLIIWPPDAPAERKTYYFSL